MSDEFDAQSIDRAFGRAMGRLGPALLGALEALERTFRRLHPPDFPRLQAGVAPVGDALDEARTAFSNASAPAGLEAFRADLAAAAGFAAAALGRIREPGSEGPMATLRAMHEHARAQAGLYPLRLALPPVSAWFAEPFARGDLTRLEARDGSEAEVGLFRSRSADEAGEGTSVEGSADGPSRRGGFDLYVPESYDGTEAWPLIVALHGGAGHGADFLWTWLREARSRRCLLLSPTSIDSTWSLRAPAVDGRALVEATEWVASRWRVDRDRILLTGLSDGGTMTALVGLGEDVPFTHLAPACGVLHPMNLELGNLARAGGKPIYLVHGALDWMFPVERARDAARVLEEAGADLVYRELADLSHTYPREENARIVAWLDPRRGAADTT